MDDIVAALAAQHAELSSILIGLTEQQWHSPTRCDGWDVADVVLHLAQTDEMGVASAMGRFDAASAHLSERDGPTTSIDAAAATMVELERGEPSTAILARWSAGALRLIEVLDGMNPSTRVIWVAGELSVRTLTTTRLAETWIHTGDVAEAVQVDLVPSDRLRLIARLAWRTLPYAFGQAGRALAGPVAFRLTSPGGDSWDFVPDEPAVTSIWGDAVELCAVAARRLCPSETSLHGEGPDAADVLELVRTYA